MASSIPGFSRVLPPHTFAADSIHYASKIQPIKQERWPLGASLSPANISRRYPAAGKTTSDVNTPQTLPNLRIKKGKRKGPGKKHVVKQNSLAPSVRDAVLKFVQNDCYKSNLDLFAVTNRCQVELMQEAWKRGLEVAATRTDTACCHIPVSTVEHENTQLVWGRTSIKTKEPVELCSHGDECDALKLRGNQGPLHRYMSPEEQSIFDSEGTHPSGPSFCLLCIRRDVHAVYLAHSAVMVNSTRQLDRGTFVIPPFQNLVDCPGGYNLNSIGVNPSEFSGIPVHIVGVSGSLTVCYDSQNKQFFIDQGGIIYTGSGTGIDNNNPDF